MGLNFKEALATVSRALPLVLIRAGVFVAGGFLTIIFFGMLLFAGRMAGGSGSIVMIGMVVLGLGGEYFTGRMLERFFLYRQSAALLFLYSGRSAGSPGLSAAIREAARSFPAYSAWAALKRKLRRLVFANTRGGTPATATGPPSSSGVALPVAGVIGQAILALAFSRGGSDITLSAREGLALFLRHGDETRRLARRWLWSSAHCLAIFFLCLALPNWFFFSSAGAPVWIGMALAAAIAWLLHRAFVAPFVLAGISSTLLAETRGRTPDPDLVKNLARLMPDSTSPDGPTK